MHSSREDAKISSEWKSEDFPPKTFQISSSRHGTESRNQSKVAQRLFTASHWTPLAVKKPYSLLVRKWRASHQNWRKLLVQTSQSNQSILKRKKVFEWNLYQMRGRFQKASQLNWTVITLCHFHNPTCWSRRWAQSHFNQWLLNHRLQRDHSHSDIKSNFYGGKAISAGSPVRQKEIKR